jgi:hypothetical protein
MCPPLKRGEVDEEFKKYYFDSKRVATMVTYM